MSLVKFNDKRWPWNYGLAGLLEQNEDFNDDFFNLEKTMPAMNIKEHENDIEIELASPGFEKKDFEITMKDDVLEITAKKSGEEEEKDDEYARKEFNYRAFRRSLQLPNTVDDTKDVKAKYENGILKLHLVKKEKAKQKEKRKIEVI